MTNEKSAFLRLNIKKETKREIDILAAHEQRDVYKIVEDMLTLYKAVAVGKHPVGKNSKAIPVEKVISHYEAQS
jgi:hypothetical protein